MLPVADKIMRMRVQIAMIKNGFVRIPKMRPGYRVLAPIYDVSEGQARRPGRLHDPSPAVVQPEAIRTLNHHLLSTPQAQKPYSRDDNAIVTMRNKGKPAVHTMEGKCIHPDKDGYYRMRWKDAKWYLGAIGWQLI